MVSPSSFFWPAFSAVITAEKAGQKKENSMIKKTDKMIS